MRLSARVVVGEGAADGLGDGNHRLDCIRGTKDEHVLRFQRIRWMGCEKHACRRAKQVALLSIPPVTIKG